MTTKGDMGGFAAKTKDTTMHTPGPWGFDVIKDEAGIPDEYVVYGNHPSDLDEIADIKYSEVEGRQRANAALIAAAPELLEALKVAREWMGSDAPKYQNGAHVLKDAQKLVDRVISKAEGV